MNQTVQKIKRLRHPTIWAIIAVATVVFLLNITFDLNWNQEYGAVPIKIRIAGYSLLSGEFSLPVWTTLLTLVTPLFLHGGPDHILLNMVFLWVFGSLVSQHLGKWWALGLFLATGVFGNLVQIMMNPDSPIPMIGASGAVCGFEGVYLGLAFRWRLPWPDVWPLARPIPPLQLAAFAVIGAVMDIYMLTQQGDSIAHGAHLGGFVSGLAIACAITQIYHSENAFQKTR